VTTDDSTRAWGQIQYLNSGAPTSITADSLKDLLYSLRAPYRTGATWVMSSNTANAIDKMKDGEGDYIWRNSYTAGIPPSLLGYNVAFDESMPTIGAGTYPIAFGNWKLGYLAAKKMQTRLLRDPYTAKPNLVLYGYKRQGGAVANSEAIKVLKIAAA
jgi:HK97 family phage major capsid protein